MTLKNAMKADSSQNIEHPYNQKKRDADFKYAL
jgi:hypothetical protein